MDIPAREAGFAAVTSCLLCLALLSLLPAAGRAQGTGQPNLAIPVEECSEHLLFFSQGYPGSLSPLPQKVLWSLDQKPPKEAAESYPYQIGRASGRESV